MNEQVNKGGRPFGMYNLGKNADIRREMTRVYRAFKDTIGEDGPDTAQARALTFMLKTIGDTIKDVALDERLKLIEKQLQDREHVA